MKTETQSGPMFESLRLRNFKSYRDSGEIPLKPLTVIVGANNAGKSTILQALLVLKQTLDDRSNRAALVTNGPYVELNGFYDIRHKGGEAGRTPSLNPQKNQCIGIAVKVVAHNQAVAAVSSGHLSPIDAFDVDFTFSKRTGDIQVARCAVSAAGQVLAEVTHGGKKWRCGEVSRRTHPKLEVGFTNFLPYCLPPHGGDEGFGQYTEADYRALQPLLLQDYVWRVYFNRLSRVGPLRLRTPWHSSTGTRDASESGLDGANLIGALGGTAKVRKDGQTLLGRVSEWMVKHLKVLDALYIKDLDKAGTVRSLLADELGGTKGVNVAAMGEGISQVLPIIARSQLGGGWDCLLVEQPEIHLHPALQADLGDLFVTGAAGGKRQYIIETHSEHLLLRIRRRVAEGKIKPEQVAILYVEKNGTESTVRELNLNSRGHFDDWPKGFFEEAYREAMALAMASQARKPE